jgi:glycosyltransferase involved in cell wall biosynthesis
MEVAATIQSPTLIQCYTPVNTDFTPETPYNMQNKVLEAMSMGLPVVATPQSAQGLGPVPPGVLQVASTPEATVAAIAALLADPARARREGAAAAAFIRANWRWDNVYARLDAVIAGLGLPR